MFKHNLVIEVLISQLTFLSMDSSKISIEILTNRIESTIDQDHLLPTINKMTIGIIQETKGAETVVKVNMEVIIDLVRMTKNLKDVILVQVASQVRIHITTESSNKKMVILNVDLKAIETTIKVGEEIEIVVVSKEIEETETIGDISEDMRQMIVKLHD